ncbi:MAG: alpha/beta hydrolase [Dehalococcoidia bacterium]
MRITPRDLALVTLLLIACAAAFLAGGVPSPPRTVEAQQPVLAWSGCGRQFECATLAVPVDYEQPTGRQIEVRLIRLPAREPSARIGALLSNPGGPGGSGIEFMRSWSRIVDGDIRDRFDLVSFDPRGVGESSPLLCHDNARELIGLDPVPSTADEWAEVRRVIREFAELCAERGGEVLPFLGSLDVARDMDRIREALGEERITYVGYSYGTVLGALYAELFPERLRAAVLDGPVDLSLSPDELNVTQAAGFERALQHFIADCLERDCALARDGDPVSALAEMVERAREAPIPSADADRPAGPGEAFLAIVASMYREAFWPSLVQAVEAGLDGDGTWLVQLADRLWGRRGDEYNNSIEMNTAVNCLDYEYSRDPAHYEEAGREAEQVSPTFGAAFGATGLACAYWAAPSKPIGAPDAPGAPPLLVVGTTGDPATPFEWALAMRRDLVTSTLLTFEGEGHTAYASGSRCVDDVVNAYLLDLALPEDGAICGLEASPRAPATPPADAFPAKGTLATPAATAAGPDASAAPPDGEEASTSMVWVSTAVLGSLVLAGVTAGLLMLRRRGDGTA